MAQQGGSVPGMFPQPQNQPRVPEPLPVQPGQQPPVGAATRQQPQSTQTAQPPQPQAQPARVPQVSNQPQPQSGQPLRAPAFGRGGQIDQLVESFKKGGKVKKKKSAKTFTNKKGKKIGAKKGKARAARAVQRTGREAEQKKRHDVDVKKRKDAAFAMNPSGRPIAKGADGNVLLDAQGFVVNRDPQGNLINSRTGKPHGSGSGASGEGGTGGAAGGTTSGGTFAAGGAGGAGSAGGAGGVGGGAGGPGGSLAGGVATKGNIATGAGTLGDLLSTGAPTDVQPIIDANAAAAKRNFEQLVDPSITEEFGALGLGSSSARIASTGREAGNVAARLGEEGARLGVGAQEAATGRRLAAFGPLQGAQGQTLQDIISQRGDLTQRLGIKTSADVSREGIKSAADAAAAGLISSEKIASGGQNIDLLRTLLPGLVSGGGALGGGGGPTVPKATPLGGGPLLAEGGTVAPDFLSGILSRLTSAGGENLGGTDRGGKRENFQDFISNLVFGRNFGGNQPGTTREGPLSGGLTRSVGGRGRAPQITPSSFKGPDSEGLRAPSRGFTSKKAEQFDPLAFIEQLGGKTAGIFPAVSIAGGNPTDFQRGALQLGGNLGDFLTNALGTGGFEDGGSVNGPSQPADQVPIMATGGEIVVPLDLVAKLKESTNPDPLIQDLQSLIGKPGKGAGESFQIGGPIDTAAGNEFLQGIGGEGAPTFTNQDLDSPPSDFGADAGGTFSELGVPPLDELQRLLEQRSLAESGLQNLQSAQLGSPVGSILNPAFQQILASKKEDLERIDQNIATIQQRDIAQQQVEASATTAEGQLLQGQAANRAQDFKFQQAQNQLTEQEAELLTLLGKPDAFGNRLPPEEQLNQLSVLAGPNASPGLRRLLDSIPQQPTEKPAPQEVDPNAEATGVPQDPDELEALLASGKIQKGSPNFIAAREFAQTFAKGARSIRPDLSVADFFVLLEESYPSIAALIDPDKQSQEEE